MKRKRRRVELTPELARRVLSYDKTTGILRWKKRSVDLFDGDAAKCNSWNTRYAGTRVRSAHGQGYIILRFFHKSYLAHRVSYLLVVGRWPRFEIDHKDGNGKNNRWRNLRRAKHRENAQNTKVPSNSTTGITGVVWHKQAEKFMAYLNVNGKRHYLGLYQTQKAAALARERAKRRYHEFHPTSERQRTKI